MLETIGALAIMAGVLGGIALTLHEKHRQRQADGIASPWFILRCKAGDAWFFALWLVHKELPKPEPEATPEVDGGVIEGEVVEEDAARLLPERRRLTA